MARFMTPVLSLLLACAAAWAAPAGQRQAELRYLLSQDCGSCHGMTLQGGLGPSLRPEALSGKPPAMLRATVLDGRPGTPMPPWRPLVSEAEAAWLVEFLLSGARP